MRRAKRRRRGNALLAPAVRVAAALVEGLVLVREHALRELGVCVLHITVYGNM